MRRRLQWIIAAMVVVPLGFNRPALAQHQGLYILGFNGGVNSAVQAPPGVYFQETLLEYWSDGIKDQDGVTLLPTTKFNFLFWANTASWVAPFKLLGAHYSTTLMIPFANPIMDFGSVVGRTSSFGLSDMYFEPLNLGWHLKRFAATFSYGIYFPTGRYNPGATDNLGRGTWTHQLNAGETFFFDRRHTWSWTNWLRAEFHQKTRDIDLTIGDNLVWEWAIGKSFYRLVDLGLVGYGQWQVSDQGGSAAILPTVRDHVFGLGGELGLNIPKLKSRVGVRGYTQFGGVLRTQGNAIFFSITTDLWNDKRKRTATAPPVRISPPSGDTPSAQMNVQCD